MTVPRKGGLIFQKRWYNNSKGRDDFSIISTTMKKSSSKVQAKKSGTMMSAKTVKKAVTKKTLPKAGKNLTSKTKQYGGKTGGK